MQHIIRTFILTAGVTCAQLYSQAQDKTQGLIHYEITYHVHASLKPDQMQYKDLIPETVIEKAELIFKGQRLKTYFNDDIKKDEEGVSASIKIATDDGNEKYADIDKGKLWWLDKAKNPPVLVEKPLYEKDKNDIKESAETRKILDYTCRKLTVKSRGSTYTIWYTTELSLKSGTPLSIFTDKGVVLAVESKPMDFVATGIDFVPVDEKDVTPPADLKVVKSSDDKAK